MLAYAIPDRVSSERHLSLLRNDRVVFEVDEHQREQARAKLKVLIK